MGVALGVVLGSILQLVISSIGLIGLGFDYDFKIYWKNKGFRQVLRNLPARSLDQGIDYFNSIVETNLASRMVQGTVRAYNGAMTLSMAPVTLVGVAISTAAFPQMTERLSQGRPDLFRTELQAIIRVIVWLSLPIATIAYFTQDFISTFLFSKGAPIVASTLGILCIAIVFRSVYQIASRTFYAQKDTRTPLYISIFTISLNVALAILFSQQLNMGIYGLALAQSLVAVIEVLILFTIISRRVPKLLDKHFMNGMTRILLSAALMSFVTIVALAIVGPAIADQGFALLFPKFLFVAVLSFIAYILVGRLLKLEEAEQILRRMRTIVSKIAFGQVRSHKPKDM
jgi:putative peptidoglycan lipid II flippase